MKNYIWAWCLTNSLFLLFIFMYLGITKDINTKTEAKCNDLEKKIELLNERCNNLNERCDGIVERFSKNDTLFIIQRTITEKEKITNTKK